MLRIPKKSLTKLFEKEKSKIECKERRKKKAFVLGKTRLLSGSTEYQSFFIDNIHWSKIFVSLVFDS